MTVSTENRKKEERRGAGFFVRFLRKAGLAPSSVPVGAPAVGIGVRGAGVASQAILGGMLATEGGRAAFAVAVVTLMTVGVAAVSAFFTGSVRRGAYAGDLLPWVFPDRLRAAAPAELPQNGASDSLGYLAQAAKSDSWLQEKIGASEADSPEQSASAAGPQTGAPGTSGASETAGAPAFAGDRRTMLAKLQPLAGKASVVGGIGGLTRGPATGLRDAVNSGLKPVGAGRLTAMTRNKTSTMPGRRLIRNFRGGRTSDALLAANRDGRSQLYARNPAMNQAGLTFDGAGQGLQSSAAGPIGAGTAGEEGPRNRFAPSNVVDQKEVPQPAAPTEVKNSTPYQGLMYTAIGSLAIAMLLMVLAGQKKDAAKALVGPAKAAMLSAAAMLHFLAAAAAGLAAVLGGFLMKSYGQTMQGMIFIGSGGLLAAFNIKAALDLQKGAAEAEKAKGEALQGIDAKDAVINQKLDSTAPA